MLRSTVGLAVAAMLVSVPGYSQFSAGNEHEREQMYSMDGRPTYSVEGAWYGTVTIPGVGATPSLDTFALNGRRSGMEGTFLCTIPSVVRLPNPGNPNGWLGITPSGHGNWVQAGKNKYAFTAYRTIYDENGNLFGYAKNWGVITPVSDDEYTGKLNVQYFMANGTPITPVFTGDMHSQRIPIKFE